MKVSNEIQISKDILTTTVKKNDRQNGPDFQTVLKDIARTEDQHAEKVKHPGHIESVSANRINEMHSFDRPGVVEKADFLLNLLDEYRSGLEDPSKSLKELDSLLTDLKTEQESLMSFVDLFPDGDELKGVVNETLINITVESIKFDRGDYLD